MLDVCEVGPYAEPGSDAARIRALERRLRDLAAQVVDLVRRLSALEAARRPAGRSRSARPPGPRGSDQSPPRGPVGPALRRVYGVGGSAG
jgi:hypothetical protein